MFGSMHAWQGVTYSCPFSAYAQCNSYAQCSPSCGCGYAQIAPTGAPTGTQQELCMHQMRHTPLGYQCDDCNSAALAGALQETYGNVHTYKLFRW